MSDQRTPPVVPTAILDAAERAVAEASADDPAIELTLREALRTALAVALPMYELRLGAELGRLTFPCREHTAPTSAPECMRCQRYVALLGARRLIEGRTGYVDALSRSARQETDDGDG